MRAAARLVEQAHELVDIADAVLSENTGKRGPDPPATTFGKMLPGAARQKVGDDLIRGLADFHE